MKATNLRKYAPALVVALVFIAGAAAYFRPHSAPYMPPTSVGPGPEPEPGPGTPIPPGAPGKMTEAQCGASGGHWNECGSACRTSPPGTACIQMCVPYCECASTNQCPSGKQCGEYVKGTGVCQ